MKDSIDIFIFLFDVFKVCMNFRKYIEKGCLFDILIGMGINRNEKLYYFLNNLVMVIGRIGLEFVKVFLCIFLYFWNFCRNFDNNLYVVYLVFINFYFGNVKSICYFFINKVL